MRGKRPLRAALDGRERGRTEEGGDSGREGRWRDRLLRVFGCIMLGTDTEGGSEGHARLNDFDLGLSFWMRDLYYGTTIVKGLRAY